MWLQVSETAALSVGGEILMWTLVLLFLIGVFLFYCKTANHIEEEVRYERIGHTPKPPGVKRPSPPPRPPPKKGGCPIIMYCIQPRKEKDGGDVPS